MFVREYVADGPMRWYDPTYDCSWLWEEVVPDMPILERVGGLFETYDLAQGPAEIKVPVLIACGRYDYSAPYTLWEEHRHKLSRHSYALFEKSGHFPPFEEPERFDQTLLEWLHGTETLGGGQRAARQHKGTTLSHARPGVGSAGRATSVPEAADHEEQWGPVDG